MVALERCEQHAEAARLLEQLVGLGTFQAAVDLAYWAVAVAEAARTCRAAVVAGRASVAAFGSARAAVGLAAVGGDDVHHLAEAKKREYASESPLRRRGGRGM